MKNIAYLLVLLLFAGQDTFSQRGEQEFTVMFYNVENLFDTIDDPDVRDEEFTPGSSKQWNSERYAKKLSDLTRVILSVPDGTLPAIVGLAEVENEEVLNDLVQQHGLRQHGYRVILVEGNDPRGIDCGMIYRPDLFRYRSHQLIGVDDLSGDDYPLRGILYVQGTGPDGKPLHIYINHWKSRYGGVQETEHLRVYSAITIRKEVDKLLSTEAAPRVIIMGDLNDEPTNKSIFDVLHASGKRKNISVNDLYNLFYDQHNLDLAGSYSYRGTWQMYDQIIISYSLLNREDGLTVSFDGGKVLKEPWMLYHDERNNAHVPNRTYGGDNYFGGISDHFPIYTTFTW
ncbi:MAG: endonuclease [Bacteroidales bacterium]